VNTPGGYKEMFNPKANVGKSSYYKSYPRIVDAVTTWNSTNKAVHARKRRVLNSAFSDKALKSAEPFVHANLDRWCELLEEQIESNGGEWSESLNMAEGANYPIFDILGDLCFGRPFDMKEDGSQLRHVPELMTKFLAILHPVSIYPQTFISKQGCID
jgi:cytochrome P450